MEIPGYSLVNARVGFEADTGWDAFVWVRNLTDQNYFEILSAAPGGSGLIVGGLGDPRMIGLTLRRTF
jgi:iron complex outermembrane receptor protein